MTEALHGHRNEPRIGGWTTDTLHEHFNVILAEHDIRYEQRFRAQVEAIQSALTAQQTAMQAALTAADRAVNKAETASEKRFDAVNEFREALTDQTRSFMPRMEVDQRFTSLTEKVSELSTRLDRTEGRTLGLSAGWVYIGSAVGLIGVIVSVLNIIYTIIRH